MQLIIKLGIILLVLIFIECSRNASKVKAGNFKYGRQLARSEVFDNLFNVYDPSFLSMLWPKITNGVHILVDHSCWRDMNVFFKDFSEGKSWAFYAVDASGRYGSALFDGRRYWVGSKQQCLRLNKESFENLNSSNQASALTDGLFHKEHNFDTDGDWRRDTQRNERMLRVPTLDHQPPYRMSYNVLQMHLNITKINMLKTFDVTLGVCLPRSCSPYDLTSIINFSIIMTDNLKTSKTTLRTVKLTTVRQIQESYELKGDNGAILLLSITILLVTLSITATIIDFDLFKRIPFNKNTKTFNLEKYNTDPKNPNKHCSEDKSKYDSKLHIDLDKLGVANETIRYSAIDKIKCIPTITLDVNCADRTASSCMRCGKYKKQSNATKQLDNLPPCPRLNYSSSSSLRTDTEKNIFCRLLLCFSIPHCWNRIFNTNIPNKDLSMVQVTKIVATLWMIFIHVAVVVDYLSDESGDIEDHNNVYNILLTGTIAFDTLFFVSGLISCHHFFYLRSQYSMAELVGFRGACGQVLQFVCFVTNRIIRLLTPYAFVVLLTAVLSRVSHHASVLELPDYDQNNCDSYWWRSLLFVSTMYPSREQCMQISWYLSTETQLHVLGALLCAASASSDLRARLCITLALCASLASTVADASAAFFDYRRLTDVFAAYTTIIERPWARVAPYFIGILTGWLIHSMHGHMKVSKVTSFLLWTTSASFITASAAMPWLGVPWVASWLHLTWPIALIWPVILCTTRYSSVFRRMLESPAVAGMSRLCYGMLLLHGPVSRAVLLSTDSMLCSHFICIWIYFTGTTILTIPAAFLLSLLIEMPFCSILRRLSDCVSV